ncbi:NTP-PPase_u3 domain containing protein [uncultured Caudovirales phage]|uniref:NTP-PPase_u3 domain containing protein n=1 Tax=uncultured Caudovirales phage TaxID=2100421 RepID=A0A6J5N7L5_9CAUD|nr:NTP-PPase_u3 domain containing protein [uncultured Caudovirales phage]
MNAVKNESELNVINWASDRNLLKYDNRFVQLAKVMEELGELAKAMLENDQSKIIDSLGDTNVTLIILANQLKLSLGECLEIAFDEIKNRKGETINGTFIKKS